MVSKQLAKTLVRNLPKSSWASGTREYTAVYTPTTISDARLLLREAAALDQAHISYDERARLRAMRSEQLAAPPSPSTRSASNEADDLQTSPSPSASASASANPSVSDRDRGSGGDGNQRNEIAIATDEQHNYVAQAFSKWLPRTHWGKRRSIKLSHDVPTWQTEIDASATHNLPLVEVLPAIDADVVRHEGILLLKDDKIIPVDLQALRNVPPENVIVVLSGQTAPNKYRSNLRKLRANGFQQRWVGSEYCLLSRRAPTAGQIVARNAKRIGVVTTAVVFVLIVYK